MLPSAGRGGPAKQSILSRARAAADASSVMDGKSTLVAPSALGRVDRDGRMKGQQGMDRSPGEVEKAKRLAISEQKEKIVEKEMAKKKARTRSVCRPLGWCLCMCRCCQSVTGCGGDRAWRLINPNSRVIAQSLVSKFLASLRSGLVPDVLCAPLQ